MLIFYLFIFIFFCPRISSALTCGIASVFSLSLFLHFISAMAGGVFPSPSPFPAPAPASSCRSPPPPYLGVAAPSASSPRLSRLTSQQTSSLALSLSRRNRNTSRCPFCIFSSSPCVYFGYFCLKRITETHFLTPLSLISVLGNGVRFFPAGRSLAPTRCLGFLNGLQQWRRATE